jgi:aminoglycoside phosphotransferase family enzyme/predicted kinase
MDALPKNPTLTHLLARLGGQTLVFPHTAVDLQLLQTHISLVLLAGDFAYKIKKPVKFTFVDYSTLERREAFCRMEMNLNRRLSEGVYLGVVPLTRQGEEIRVEGSGEALEYAVKMRRLPDENRLGRLLESGGLPEDFWARLSARLVRFYAEAARGGEVSSWAEFQAVREDWRDILKDAKTFPAETLRPALREKMEKSALETLDRNRDRIESRADLARDGHGDLRLEHIYFFPGESGDRALQIIDCVEFNPRYRCNDPVADIAFLAMDLEASGFRRESGLFTESFWKAYGREGADLLDFYVAYRHLVRGLVRTLQYQQGEETPEERASARDKARLHFLQAFSKLERPGARPSLILLGGLPGSGKSSLAGLLAREEEFQVFSSDAVRKELAGVPLESNPGGGFRTGIYSPEWTEKTFAELLRRAEASLLEGKRVLVDATFVRQMTRERFWGLAKRLGLPFLFFVCQADRETVRQRLARKDRYASDADFKVYEQLEKGWEAPEPFLETRFLNAEKPLDESLREIRGILKARGLSD